MNFLYNFQETIIYEGGHVKKTVMSILQELEILGL